MGKPAARMGDQTVHGGTIIMGAFNVLIGGMPAARVTDMHICPMVTGLVPHVGGPIALGSLGVLTVNLPQARIMDMAICVGPPDLIAKGQPNVLVGELMPGAAVAAVSCVLSPKLGAAAPGPSLGPGAAGTAAGKTMSLAKRMGAPFVKPCPKGG